MQLLRQLLEGWTNDLTEKMVSGFPATHPMHPDNTMRALKAKINKGLGNNIPEKIKQKKTKNTKKDA